MQVSIQPSTEKTGLVFKKTVFQVAVDVTLTEEEKATCRDGAIEEVIVFSCPHCDGKTYDVLVNYLYGSTVWKGRFWTQLEANDFQAYVKNQIVEFKETIEGLADQLAKPVQGEKFEI